MYLRIGEKRAISLPLGMALMSMGLYGWYLSTSGPSRLFYTRTFTLQPEAGVLALPLSNFCPTSFLGAFAGSVSLATIGSLVLKTRGLSAFAAVVGASCAGASLFACLDMRHNQNRAYAGGMGMGAGLLTYTAFTHPHVLNFVRFTPMTLVFAAVAYGFYYRDMSVIGGISGGYLAFLLAL